MSIIKIAINIAKEMLSQSCNYLRESFKEFCTNCIKNVGH